MKRVLLILFILFLMCGGIAAWIFLGPATGFSGKTKTLYIASDAPTKKAVLDSLRKNQIISNETAFEFLAERMNYWKKIRPGKYEVDAGTSLLELVRRLRRGQQTPVDLVINKIRTKEDFAKMVGRKFETDSSEMMAFMNNRDSLAEYDVQPEQSMAHIIPDKYTYFWNSSPATIYEKLYNTSRKFWTDERIKKAADLGLKPVEVYILASIIEEETTLDSEKDTIASVYLNRLRIGQALQADPTLKFAARQFELKRIEGEILNIESPYNTYRNAGLPPGPICTPSRKTIDAVLNPASTPYFYFVAMPNLRGHLFSVSFEEHLQKARQYWKADDKRQEQQGAKATK